MSITLKSERKKMVKMFLTAVKKDMQRAAASPARRGIGALCGARRGGAR